MYGDHLGKPELRDLIAADAPPQFPLSRNDVMLTVGAASALFIVCTALLKPADRVLVVFPNYVTNISTPAMMGCAMDYFELQFEHNFKIDVDALIARIQPDTKLVSVTVPHNPTGASITEAELQRLVAAVEAHPGGCRLLFDETYREMSFVGVLPPAAALSPR